LLSAQDVPITGVPVPALQAYDSLIVNYMQKYQLVGGALAIAHNGRLVYARGFGYSDVLAGKLVQPDTLFRVASVSKVITSRPYDDNTALMAIGDNSTILAYVPGQAPASIQDPRLATITFRECLDFTTGLSDAAYGDIAAANASAQARYPPPAFVLNQYTLAQPLLWDPGSNTQYSGIGYSLIGRAWEFMTGIGYEQLVREQMFAKRGLFRPRIGATRQEDLSPWETLHYPYPRNLTAKSDYDIDPQPVSVPYSKDEENVDAQGGWTMSAIDVAFIDAAKIATTYDAPPQNWSFAYWGGWQGIHALMLNTWEGYSFGAVFNTTPNRDIDPADDLGTTLIQTGSNISNWPTGDQMPAFQDSWNQPPAYIINTTPVIFSYGIGGAPPPSQARNIVQVSNSEGYKLTSPNRTWLTLSMRQGLGPSQVTVGVDTRGLVPGDYYSSIYLESTERPHSPIVIPVRLHVTPSSTLRPFYVSTPQQLPDAVQNTVYSIQLNAVGGQMPLTWQVYQSELPGGLSLQPDTGLLTGTPVNVNDNHFMVRVVDSGGRVTFRPFDLSIRTSLPFITQKGVVNAASFSTFIAPGSLVSIFGANFAHAPGQAQSTSLPTTLNGVTVTFNGLSAPISYVSSGQVNAEVPWEVRPGNVNVVVTLGGVSSAPAVIQVYSTGQGIFRFAGSSQAVAVNLDGSLVAPEGTLPGIDSKPAHAGDTIILYGTGFGLVTPQVAAGSNSTDVLRTTQITPQIRIGGVPAQVTFSGLSPQFIGVNQLNVMVPIGAPIGDFVRVSVYDSSFTDTGSTVAIRAN